MELSVPIKIIILLFSLSSHQVKGGEQFKNCLEEHADNYTGPLNKNLTGLYDEVKNFVANNVTDKEYFCCDTEKKCGPMSPLDGCDKLVSSEDKANCLCGKLASPRI